VKHALPNLTNWFGQFCCDRLHEICSSGVDVTIAIFCDFCPFSAKKLAFFSKTNVMIIFLQQLAVV
jgi:hypothetical protein